MARNCTDRESLALWCASVAGDSPEERRSELLWRYVKKQIEPRLAAEIEQHVAACEDCRGALEAERLLAGGDKVVLAVCPSSEEVLQYLERDPALGPWRRLEIKQHVARCVLCREEAEWAAGHVAIQAPAAAEPETRRAGWFSWKWAWASAAAAMIVVAVVLIYPSPFGDRRFARLAHLPDVPYELILTEFGEAHPDDLPRFRAATQLISLGDYSEGGEILRELERKHSEDPSIVFFKGYAAARQGRWRQATLLCSRAESSDLDGFRCWYLANVALMAGEVPLARKELQHAKGHTPYKERAARLERLVN